MSVFEAGKEVRDLVEDPEETLLGGRGGGLVDGPFELAADGRLTRTGLESASWGNSNSLRSIKEDFRPKDSGRRGT